MTEPKEVSTQLSKALPRSFRSSALLLLLLGVSSILMARQIFSDGYFSCIVTDTFTYTGWAWQFNEALREGIVYPRWMPNHFWGYGSPTFILYPPLAFYLSSFFTLFTNSTVAAMNVTKHTALCLTCVGIFFLVKEFYSLRAAFFSALFYAILPYTMMQYYVFGGFASTVSFFWFAPLLLFTYRYMATKEYRHIAYAGLCYGGLLLTHLINAYMFTFVLAVFVIYFSIIWKQSRTMAAFPAIMFIGFMVSAAYTLPLLLEKHLVQLEAFVKTGSGFTYSDYFILPHVLNFSATNVFWQSYYSDFAQHVTILLILTLSLSLILLFMHKKVSDEANYWPLFSTISLLSLFMLFGASSPVWDSFPFFKYIQFPVRWLHITMFTVPILLGSLLHRLDSTYVPRNKYTVPAIILFTACTFIDYKIINKACIFNSSDLFPIKSINFSTEHLPAGVDLNRITKESVRVDNKILIHGKGTAEVTAWKTAEKAFRIKAEQPVTARIRGFDFPGWTAYLDEKRSEIKAEAGTRAIRIDVPAGNHRLNLIFKDTPVRRCGKMISICSLILLSTYTFAQKYAQRKAS